MLRGQIQVAWLEGRRRWQRRFFYNATDFNDVLVLGLAAVLAVLTRLFLAADARLGESAE